MEGLQEQLQWLQLKQEEQLQLLQEERKERKEERKEWKKERKEERKKQEENFTKMKDLLIQANKLAITQTTSYLEYHESLCRSGLVINAPELGKILTDCSITDLELDDVYENKGGEDETVQPYWTRKMRALNISLKQQGASVQFWDTHNIPFLEKHKPDSALTTCESAEPSTFNTVVLGENKGAKLDNKAKGQLEKYLSILLNAQPFRVFAYGYLTNNQHLLVVRAERQDSKIHFKWIVDTSWGADGKARNVMSFLLTSSKSDLGYELPEVPQTVTLTASLGCGISGNVYRGEKAGLDEDVVVKVFACSERCSMEKDTLSSLEKYGVKMVPSICDSSSDVLVLQPLGTPFARGVQQNKGRMLSPSDVTDLVTTLWQAHSNGIVHRDIQERNIFSVGNGVLLNDWGSACKVGQLNSFEGWVAGSSDYVLNRLTSPLPFVYRYKDDLHGLVRTVYCILVGPSYFMPPKIEEIAKIKYFWSNRGSAWTDLIRSAESTIETKESYANFAKEFESVFRVIDRHLYSDTPV